jgi:hypothetical protein
MINWLKPAKLLRLCREKTGAVDLHGYEIREGDTVLLFKREFARKLLNPKGVSSGEVPIYKVDRRHPLPVKDVPLARGIAGWDPYSLAWVIRLKWVCQEWDAGIAAVFMGGSNYAYEIL